MPDLDDKYSEFSREIGNDEPTQDNAAGAAKEPQPDFSDNADLYAVLCVSKTASSDEIKSAYRRLAKEYHPDVSSDADADEKFKKIQHAYETLFDEVQRAMYDLGGDSMAGLSYEQRLKTVFQGRIVRKDLTKKIKEGANVPVYVLEFLLGQYCSSDDPAIIETGVETVKKILSDNFVRPDEAQKILSLLKMNGSHTIIDMVTVHLDMRKDVYLAEFSNLGVKDIPIEDEYPQKYDRLLCGGIWCIVQLSYEFIEEDKKSAPIRINRVTPIQMPHVDLDEIRQGRKAFSKEEWLGLMLRSAGYEPESLTYREQWLLLTRMIPLVENNFNLCELGPRSTGKSHIYKEISPNSILVSGGQTTVANLFYNMGRKTVGLVGLWDCVAFDEVAGIKFKDKDGVQIMKDYMAEFIRELRKVQYGDALDKYFKLGKNLNQRDTIAVRRMVDGYLKLMYPNGEFSKDELEEVLRLSLEMRRRVKEQLKKLGGMEFYDVNFSYIDNETFEEKYVSVPEQGGDTLIPEGMGAPGQLYTISRGKSGMIGAFRLESQMLPGSGKFDKTGLGSDGKAKEAANTAFNFLKANARHISGNISTTAKDYIVNYQDLQGIGMTEKLALPTVIALCSIAIGRPTLSSLAVLGDISIGGTLIKVDELANTLQACADCGAKKVLLPAVSMVDFATVPADLMTAFQLIPYQNAEDAVFKALGVE